MPGPNYTIFLRAQPSLVIEAYAWPAKDASETLAYAVDGLAWLTVNKMTLVSFTVVANVTLALLGSGLMTVQGVNIGVWLRISGGVPGSTPAVVLRLLLLDEYGDQCIRTVTVALPIITLTPSVFSAYPTSPVLLPLGATWYARYRNALQIVPLWSALPTTEPANADAFWLNGAAVAIASNTTLLPTTPINLALGDLWNNGGIVMCNGNPGLPVSSSTPGTLLYNGGALGLS